MRKLFKPYLVIYTAIFLSLLLAGCGGQSEEQDSKGAAAPKDYPASVKENPTVTMTMENDKKIVLELYPKVAPNTVANFISLVEEGFYEGIIFHRVIPNFMIQGGDPSGNGTGGPNFSIKGEFTANGFENKLSHERGVLSMARTQDLDSAGSQFFIMVQDNPGLDGQYAGFGKVIEGMEVVDEIVSVKRNEMDKPLTDQIIKKATVDTKGYQYPEAEVVE